MRNNVRADVVRLIFDKNVNPTDWMKTTGYVSKGAVETVGELTHVVIPQTEPDGPVRQIKLADGVMAVVCDSPRACAACKQVKSLGASTLCKECTELVKKDKSDDDDDSEDDDKPKEKPKVNKQGHKALKGTHAKLKAMCAHCKNELEDTENSKVVGHLTKVHDNCDALASSTKELAESQYGEGSTDDWQEDGEVPEPKKKPKPKAKPKKTVKPKKKRARVKTAADKIRDTIQTAIESLQAILDEGDDDEEQDDDMDTDTEDELDEEEDMEADDEEDEDEDDGEEASEDDDEDEDEDDDDDKEKSVARELRQFTREIRNALGR